MMKYTQEINDFSGHELKVGIYAKFTTTFWIRYWIGMMLFRLGARVMNIGLVVEEEDDQ